MTTTPTPETNPFLHWMHRAETAEAKCEALIAERDEATKSLALQIEQVRRLSDLCVEVEAERDQALARVKVAVEALSALLATLDEHDSTIDTWEQMVKARAALAKIKGD